MVHRDLGGKRRCNDARWRSSSRMAALMRVLVVGLVAMTSCATTSARADDTQLWASTRLTARLAPHIMASNETVYRTSEERGDYDFVDHIQAGYQFNRHVTLWIGYTHQTAMSHGRKSYTEQRFRQQVNFENVVRLGPAQLGGRLRIEQRWRNAQSGTGWRLRPQEKLVLPVIGKISVSISHEDFIDLNRTSFQSVAGVERMRNAVTLTVPLNKHLSLEVGYLQQHLFGPTNSSSDANAATLAVSGSF